MGNGKTIDPEVPFCFKAFWKAGNGFIIRRDRGLSAEGAPDIFSFMPVIQAAEAIN
jgi:hypothetical protein